MAVFGGETIGETNPATIMPEQRAAFGVNFGAKLGEIHDGTSKTLLFAEYLRSTGFTHSNGIQADQRGMLWQSDAPGGGCVYTALSPNSTTPDTFYPDSWCSDRPERNLPCITDSNIPALTAGSRSAHAGSVNVALCDGSVRSISDDIWIDVWKGMSTIAGRNEPQVTE